jgi:hypothetical protein
MARQGALTVTLFGVLEFCFGLELHSSECGFRFNSHVSVIGGLLVVELLFVFALYLSLFFQKALHQ